MTPLERAARALSDHFGCEWETMRDADRATLTGYARAVLMAVREMPSETQAAIFDARDGFVHEIDIPAVWEAGIDAILADQPKGDE